MILRVNDADEAAAELEKQKNIKYDAFATSTAPTQDKDQLEESGYNLSPKNVKLAMEYLNKDATKKKDFPTDPTKLEI